MTPHAMRVFVMNASPPTMAFSSAGARPSISARIRSARSWSYAIRSSLPGALEGDVSPEQGVGLQPVLVVAEAQEQEAERGLEHQQKRSADTAAERAVKVAQDDDAHDDR